MTLPDARVSAVWGRSAARADHFARTHGIPVATESLDALLARDDVRVVYIATPAHTHADIAIATAGLGGLFDAEATGDEVERGKPEPDLFLLAASRLGVEPEGALVFEDAPAGVAAAKAAGMQVAWIPNEHSRELEMHVQPDFHFPSLIEARVWLDEQRSALLAGR